MKLHLPTALRRALLAITALLSPAVVTTTIATATLAAITAPAMAADLTLNAGSNAFDTDLTVEKIELASGVTSATLKPDTSTTLTVTADSICLASDQKLYLNNAKIIANKGIETLLTNVAGKDCIRMNTSSIWGSGGSSAHDVLLSSFINDKLYPNAQAYVYITKGHIQFDVGIDDVMGCYLGDGESEDSGIVSATISSELESLKIVRVASDATLDLGGGSKGFILNIRSLEGTVKTGRDLTLTGIEGWNLGYASISGSSSVCVEENSEASITLEHVKLLGGSVSAHNITILKDVIAYDYDDYESTLTATNVLHIQGDIGLENTIANAGSTIIDAGKSLTLGAGKFTTGAVTIGAGATLDLGSSTTNLKGIITNNGSLVLGGTITVDNTAFTAGTRERYSAGNNGYKITDTTYNVLTGTPATGSAKWKVGTQSATYEDGMVIVDGIEDTAVYYIRNNIVNYGTDVTKLATEDTKFSLEGGSLELGKELVNDQGIIAKTAGSSVEILSNTTLKSNQLSVVPGGSVELSGNGAYEITGTELSLGSGVSVGSDWSGTVKTTGATTVSSVVDTTGWKNTELNGTTTVNSGVTLTLGGNTKLKGQIVNNGTLVLGGNIDVLGSMTHTSKATFATTSAASDLGTESGSGFATTLDVYTVVDGNAATGTATWTVGGQAAHYDSGKVSLLTGKDTTTWWMNAAAAYSSISGNFVTGSTTTLALNTEGGTLQLDTDPGVKLVSKKVATIEIGNAVTLNAAQLDASAADVTLTGSGSYTIADGANTLGAGVRVGSDWSGTVNTIGDTTALELNTLGVSGSKVELGSNSHTLAAQDQSVAANLNSTGSISLTGNKLTLSGTNELGSLNVGSLAITGGSTTITNGLTTGGESSVATGATLSLSGNSTLGGKISNNGSLVLGGNIDVLGSMTHTSKATFATTGDASDLGTESGSGFASSLDVYTVVDGNAATGTATWTVGGQAAHYDSGKVSLMTSKDTTTWWMNSSAAYSTISGNFVTGSTMSLALNTENGTLQLDTAPGVKLVSKKATTVEIADTVTLNANQLDARAADVTLTGSGSYTMVDGANTLGAGVRVGSDWSGTVNTIGDTTALELNTLGVSGSKVELGSNSHTLAAQDQSVAANLNSTGSISLTGNKLTLSGTNELGSLNVGSLEIAGGSTEISNGLTTGGAITNNGDLNLSGTNTLGGKITNNGSLVLGGNIDVLGSMTHTSKATFATTGDASDLGTESGSGFASSLDVYSVVEGNSANGSATWTVDGKDAHYDSGKVSLMTGKDTTIWWMNTAAAYSTISGNFVTGSTTTLALNTEDGTLQLDTDPGVNLVSKKASTVEIGNGVTLNASQLDASAAAVTLSGSGSYTMKDGANALGEGVNVGTGWSGTVKLTGAADALELSSLGNALSSIDLGSFTHTLADGEHEIDSALVGSGSLNLKEGSKLTLNGDCSKWSGDIIGQVELELTEGGTIGGNVQVDSLLIEESSTTFEKGLITTGTITVKENASLSLNDKANLTTKGTITVADNATLSLNGNTTLGGTIESADSGTVELAGHITVDVENFKSSTEVKDVTGYFIGRNTTPNSINSGFEAACWDITIAKGGSITDKGANWKLVGDENATFDFAADGTLHAYGSGVGTVFHVAGGDTITYSEESNDAVFVNSKDTEATAISLNGGTLVLNTDLRNTADDYVKSTAASTIEIGNDVNLNARQLDASAAKVTLSGSGSYNLQGQELRGVVELNTGVVLDANEWKGTVYTGSTKKDAELDITALGNSQSTVYLGAQPMRRNMPDETVLERLIADGVGTTETPGALTLQKGESTADALVVNGILTLGSADAVASLVAVSVDAQALNVQLTDEVLSNKDAGETLTLVTLEEGFEGSLTFNDSTETERVRSEDNRKEYTLVWNEDGTVLTLTILGTETYVAEQVKPTTHNGKAGVALMTDVFLNSRPQKDAPDGALAGILNAVDAGTATDRDMAAVAGASTAALGMALSGDVERQLRAIRNRSLAGNDAATITLVDEKAGMVSAEAPARFFAWVNAEGNRAEQNDDSTAAGYTLTSWGGTLGAGMQVNDQLTLGLALTAMYGDLQSDGPDYLKGDMDTTYVSAFARYNRGKWSHAFIGTAGTMEADYKRSAMSYSTDGDTDGTAFGLMYEVSREFELGNLSTLSPVLNIAYRHTTVDSYSESGADAALNVDKQSMDTVTLGAGARYAAVVGQQTLNRACGFEARALVKYDLGDRQSTTSTGFTGYATRAGIESAELGAFGVELGAGISVPVGTGSIFADGAVELRSDYTNFNAAVGYRVQF